MESAVHSVWHTLRTTLLSDTAMSAGVRASDSGHIETTTKLAFSKSLHSSLNVQYILDLQRSDLTVTWYLLYSHCEQVTSVQMNIYYKLITSRITAVRNYNVYSITHAHTHTVLHGPTIS